MINVNNILLSSYQKQTTLLAIGMALFLTSLTEKNILSNQRIYLCHLHTFATVTQQGTLGRAAKTPNLNQPALSRTLNELEQLTSTRLLERGHLDTQLTLPKEQLPTHAVRVLDALNTTRQVLNQREESQTDIVRIRALPTATLGILSAVIDPFHRRQMKTALQVTTMNSPMILVGLKSRKIDLDVGRIADPELMAGLNYELLFLESLKLVVRPSHPLLQETIVLSRVVEWPVVVSSEGTAPRRHAEALLQSQGRRMPSGCIETSSASLSHQLMVDYGYVWFVPSGTAREDLCQTTLVSLPIPTHGAGEPVGIPTRVNV